MNSSKIEHICRKNLFLKTKNFKTDIFKRFTKDLKILNIY